MYVLRPSGWEFVTSGSGGFSVDVVAVEGGVLELRDPPAKVERFHFGEIGAGVSTPIKGRTATVMMLGLDPTRFYAALGDPALQAFDVVTGHPDAVIPKALVWIWGDIRGLVAGATGYVGHLR